MDLRDHHRNDGPGLGDARDLGHHARLDDLRFDLRESGMHRPPPHALRDQDPGRAHERIDDVAHLQGELLHMAADAGADHRLVQLDLRLSQFRLRARLLGRQQGGKPRLGGLLGRPCGVDPTLAPLREDLESLDIALRDCA